MSTIQVSSRARPMRFAFLVSPNNAGDIRAAIETCTVLWGGMFNALVPVVDRITTRWSTARTGPEVVRGYLEAFEPDFVVTGTGVDPTKYGVASSISFPLASMSTKDGLRTRAMTAMPVYRWRHEQELRFVQRQVQNPAQRSAGVVQSPRGDRSAGTHPRS